MSTAANVKTLKTIRPKPSFTTRKTTHLNPIKRKMSKTATQEYLPMVLQPPPVAQSVQQYAIPLIGSGRGGNSDVMEMLQICNKLDEYTKDLETVYEKKNGEVAAESSHMGRQFSSFLSTCASATRELDTTINVEHKILESLYEGYQKEAHLLEQFGAEDITTDIPASYDKVSVLISKLMEILHKLEGIKSSFQNLPKAHLQEHLPVSPPIKIEKKKRGAQIQGPDLKSGWDDHSQDTERVVKALQELMTDTDNRSQQVLERIIREVGQLFDTQAIELQKLGKDQEETENKYVKVKTNYQALLREKGILEMELKKLLAWKANQKSSPMLTPGLEEKDVDPVPSTLTSAVIKHESGMKGTFSCRSEQEIKKVAKLFKSEDKAELQEDAASPADIPVTTLHKKAKIQKGRDTDFSEISYTHGLDQGDICMSNTAEPSDPDVVELKDGAERSDGKVKTKKQKLKSLKSRGRSTVPSKTKLPNQAGTKSSKTTFTSSEKPEDKLFPENKEQRDPEMISNVSNQRKTGTKLSKTPSSSGKGKAKLNEEDAITMAEPSVQAHRAKESAPSEQQVRPGGADSSAAPGKQQGRRQSLSSKSRRLSVAKGEKLENEKQKQKDPTEKIQIMKVIPENQHEKQIANKKVHAVRFEEPSVDNMEVHRDPFTGHGPSKTPSPDQDSFSNDSLEHGRKDECVKSSMEGTAIITQYSGKVQEDTLPHYHVSEKTFLATTSTFTQTDPPSTSDSAVEALGTQDFMDSCKMEHAEDISPHYDGTKKTYLSSISEFIQTEPSDTFDRTFHIRGKMGFPDSKEQSAIGQLSSDDDGHHAQLKVPQTSQPSSAVTTYPPAHPNIQRPDPDDVDDTSSRVLLSEKIPDKADKETAQSGKQLEPAMVTQEQHEPDFTENVQFMKQGLQTTTMTPLHLEEQTDKYRLPLLEHKRQQFGEDILMWIGQSPQKLEVTNLPLLGQSAGPQTEILKFHPSMIPSQRHQIRKVQTDEFLSYDNTFSQSFGTGLFVQGRHISFTHSLSTEKNSSGIPSPTHPKERAEKRTQLLYRKRETRIFPTEHFILPNLTERSNGRGADSTSIPSGKWNSQMSKENGLRKHPAQQITPQRRGGFIITGFSK